MEKYKPLVVKTHKTLTVSSPPHIYGKDTTERRMRDVIIALLPASLMGVYRFGVDAFFVISVAIISAMLAEYLFQKVTGKVVTINDFSAVITGLLLALSLPPNVPLWVPALGSVFAIVAVKQLFGGLGSNFINPALGARAFLLAAFPVHMTRFPAQVIDGLTNATPIGAAAGAADTITGATYLAVLRASPDFTPQLSDYVNLLWSKTGGSIGEVSAILIVLGGLYLIVRKVINWRIPVFYIGSFALFAFILGRGNAFSANVLFEIMAGGLLVGAFFMATDYATSPITKTGKIIMGVGCGFLTVIIRFYGGFPEGVTYAILIMNIFVPTIDKYITPRIYGKARRKKA